MTSPRKISDDRDETVATGNLDTRARAAASKATTMAQFRKLLGIQHDQALALNERLKLNVPLVRKDRAEAPAKRAVPKPTAKKGAGK